MSSIELPLYDNLKKKLDEETARQLITFLKEEIREEVNQNKLVTKDDLAQAKIDLIKWMFGFWVTLVLLILANWFFK
jgi:hypothetical protein